MILEFAYVYPQKLKVVVKEEAVGAEPQTHAEELTNVKCQFHLVVKTPLSLVPYTGGYKLRGIQYWNLSRFGEVTAFRLVSKDFSSEASAIFFGKNIFEIHDTTASLAGAQSRVVAHRWLEYMDKLGLLQHLRRLNVDMRLADGGQSKWHVHRTFAAIVSIERLERLVVTVDMAELWNAGEDEFDEDYQFHYYNAAPYPKEWPGVRMLAWAASAVPKKGYSDDKVLRVFIPQVRKVQRLVESWMARKDDDREKFWCAADWETPPEGFATPNIAAAVERIRARQRPEQQWVSWDEGSEDYTGAVSYELSDDDDEMDVEEN